MIKVLLSLLSLFILCNGGRISILPEDVDAEVNKPLIMTCTSYCVKDISRFRFVYDTSVFLDEYTEIINDTMILTYPNVTNDMNNKLVCCVERDAIINMREILLTNCAHMIVGNQPYNPNITNVTLNDNIIEVRYEMDGVNKQYGTTYNVFINGVKQNHCEVRNTMNGICLTHFNTTSNLYIEVTGWNVIGTVISNKTVECSELVNDDGTVEQLINENTIPTFTLVEGDNGYLAFAFDMDSNSDININVELNFINVKNISSHSKKISLTLINTNTTEVNNILNADIEYLVYTRIKNIDDRLWSGWSIAKLFRTKKRITMVEPNPSTMYYDALRINTINNKMSIALYHMPLSIYVTRGPVIKYRIIIQDLNPEDDGIIPSIDIFTNRDIMFGTFTFGFADIRRTPKGSSVLISSSNNTYEYEYNDNMRDGTGIMINDMYRNRYYKITIKIGTSAGFNEELVGSSIYISPENVDNLVTNIKFNDIDYSHLNVTWNINEYEIQNYTIDSAGFAGCSFSVCTFIPISLSSRHTLIYEADKYDAFGLVLKYRYNNGSVITSPIMRSKIIHDGTRTYRVWSNLYTEE